MWEKKRELLITSIFVQRQVRIPIKLYLHDRYQRAYSLLPFAYIAGDIDSKSQQSWAWN